MEIDPALSEPPDGLDKHPQQAVHEDGVGEDGSNFPNSSSEDILQNYNLAVERAQTWTGVARFGFNAMLASADYKNKLRLKNDKMERILYFLTIPDAKSREKDRIDAQAKHQAQQWFLHDGILYRKESRLPHPRRHVAAHESFDIITAEHLRSKHCGRDKMLKVLEAKYIGYTKDELMYVLDHCSICSSKHIRGAAARRRESRRTNLEGNEMDDAEAG